MSLASERIDATPNLVYLAKHPCYAFALTRATPSRPGLSPEPPLVHLCFTRQPHQQGIVLTLAAIAEFHDALSRLLDYIEQEHASWAVASSSGTSVKGEMNPACERRDHSTGRDHLEASHPVMHLNRPTSAGWLCKLSGMVLVGLIALLGGTLYALSASQGALRRPLATSAPNAFLHPPAEAMLDETPPQGAAGAHQLLPVRQMDRFRGIDAAGKSLDRTGVHRPPAPVASPRAAAQAGPVPHIHLYIQFPAQHEAAQRLAAWLQQKGYILPKAATLAVKGPSRTEVRYFRPTQAEEATAIAVLLHEAYRPPVTTRYIRGYKHLSDSRPGHYEIWLAPEPR